MQSLFLATKYEGKGYNKLQFNFGGQYLDNKHMSDSKQQLMVIQGGEDEQDLFPYISHHLLGKGNFGHVYMAKDISRNNKIVAIKKVKKKTNTQQGICVSFIRQISILKKLRHPNIIQMLDYGVNQNQDFAFLVFEYMPTDLQKQIAKGTLTLSKTKRIVKCILQAIAYCHQKFIVHRDIKPSNILLNQETQEVKVADFGVAKQIYMNPKNNTTRVSALYYRAPQLLLQDTKSSFPIDMWGVGCILGECVLGKNLFRADFANELSQLNQILKSLQIDNEIRCSDPQRIKSLLSQIQQKPIQNFIPQLKQLLPPPGLNLLNKLLCLNPKNRISAEDALEHLFFNEFNNPFAFDLQLKKYSST